LAHAHKRFSSDINNFGSDQVQLRISSGSAQNISKTSSDIKINFAQGQAQNKLWLSKTKKQLSAVVDQGNKIIAHETACSSILK
jgi:hypothetical protein